LCSQAIILAAPYHHTGIHFVNSLAPALIPKQPYVKLYVTFIITK
jgi:prenylcysteine oxidase/farnesylcysteine lyase